MKLTFTLASTESVQNFEVKVVKGDQVKVRYINSEGKEMIYWLKLTNNEKLVLN